MRLLTRAFAILAVFASESLGASVIFTNGPVAQNLPGNRSNISDGRQTADDFLLSYTSTLDAVRWYGSTFLDLQPRPSSFRIEIFKDAPSQIAGLSLPDPAPLVMSLEVTAFTTIETGRGTNVGQILQYEADIPNIVLEASQKYWISFFATGVSSNWLWDNALSSGLVAGRNVGSSGPSAWDWTTNRTMAFDLFGFSSLTVPEPNTLALFGLGLAGIGAVRRKKLAA